MHPTLVSFLAVAVGSALGGMARFGVSGLIARRFGETFPWGTLIVNITGSFLIGLIAAFGPPLTAMPAPGGVVAWLGDPMVRTLLMVGVCGGYTTFSSFGLQSLSLAREGEWRAAAANVVLSVVLCLLSTFAGLALGAALAH